MVKNKILVVGTGGLLRQIYPHIYNEIIQDNIVFFDNINSIDKLYGCKVIHNQKDLTKSINRFIIAVSNPLIRYKLTNMCLGFGLNEMNLISEDVLIPDSLEIGNNNIILRQVIIEEDTKIGDGNLINLGSYICHNSTIGSFCELSPRTTILGNVNIEDLTFIGSVTTICPKISIGFDSIIGGNSFVNKDIPMHSKVYGSPARIIK